MNKQENNNLQVRQTLVYLWRLLNTYKPYKYTLLYGYIMVIISSIFWIIIPLYFARFFDVIAGERPGGYDAALRILIIVLVYRVAMTIIDRVFWHIETYTGSYFIQRIQKYIFTHFQHRSYEFFADSLLGSLINKINQFTTSVGTIIQRVPMDVLGIITTLVMALIVLWREAPNIILYFVLWIILFTVLMVLFSYWKRKYDLKRAKTRSKVKGYLSDTIMNMPLIKTFHNTASESQTYTVLTTEERNINHFVWQLNTGKWTVQMIIQLVVHMSFLFFMLAQWRDGFITVGIIFLVHSYFWRIQSQIESIAKVLRDAAEALSNCTEMIEILEQPLILTDPEHPEQCNIKQGRITFKNVYFTYKKGASVFHDFSLDIPAGQKVGLVGASGSGKSTLAKLVLRHMDVQQGVVLIDGQDITRIRQDDLRRNISYVPQDSTLFHRTVRENIMYGRLEATEEEMIEAAKKAHAHEFIMRLPHEYDSKVGERGVRLSGGERQRVAIARAMLRQSPILLLDEATSSLDSLSERYIQEAFDTLMEGRTTIVVAHRLSTIEKLDRIIVLCEGEKIEEGTHTELLAKNGYYTMLWNNQSGGFLPEFLENNT